MKHANAWMVICIIVVLSIASRLLFLGSVREVVFDEVHFGKFISSYCCTHERFFDIHPPIGKLIIAGGAYLSGYNGSFLFESIGQPYGDTRVANIRMVSALAGALLPIIIFILLRQVGVSLVFAFVGALAAILDNALIVESRLIITDSILLSATFGALACAVASAKSIQYGRSWMWAVCAGVLSGIAVGTKFTGLTGGALVGLVFLVRAYQAGYRNAGVWIARGVLAGVVCVAVYILGWVLHFSLLNMPGDGDAWGVPTGAFWQDFTTVHRQMVSANYNLTADHPYGSKWWTWPFMVRSVFYWQGEGNRFIYLLGNPVVWWGGFIIFCIGVGKLFISFAKGRNKFLSSGSFIFLFGYFLSFIPLMRVPRVLFLYHYLTPLLFSLLFAIWWLDSVVHLKKREAIAVAASLGIVISFIYISPLTYGFMIPDRLYNIVFLVSSWR